MGKREGRVIRATTRRGTIRMADIHRAIRELEKKVSPSGKLPPRKSERKTRKVRIAMVLFAVASLIGLVSAALLATGKIGPSPHAVVLTIAGVVFAGIGLILALATWVEDNCSSAG